MNQTLAFSVLTGALLFPAAGCGSMTANPIDGGGGSSSSSATTGSSSSSGATGDGGMGGTGGGGGAPGGDCVPACGSGEICVEASCHALAPLDTGTSLGSEACNIVVDATNVYWQTTEVRRVPKGGGNATSMAWTTQPSSLVVDAQYLYWTGGNSGIHRAEKLMGKNGVPFADQGGDPGRMAGDGTSLYSLEGMNVMMTDTAPPATTSVFSSSWSSIGGIAVDATSVYYWSTLEYSLVKENKATHAITKLSQPEMVSQIFIEETAAIVVDGDSVYFSSSPEPGTGGVVARVSGAGGAATVLVDSSVGASGVFAVDATSVYFMTPTGVMKMAKTGGAPVLVSPLSPPTPFPTCMAVDEEAVYWVDGVTLMKYTK